ncbi:tRNA-dihydrouridine(47) synthase [NAD(P)(+)]-like [Strongylocentrotus purpuratus]|uniref:tRNA-dihydrouridine(47) synthase [NAD(P)(+)] n=1 Tax=Strongylocentrotus purpuratus TaxID=7668 RepID=A0A7M7P6A8_STRPU|nr:tRNA-dihydrouridine(47) synthase [NAD(P)(+)]-like [Strongylocentrotus purpuratus]
MADAQAEGGVPAVEPTVETENQVQDQVQVPSQEELLAHVRAQPGTALVKARYIDLTRHSKRNYQDSTTKASQEQRNEPEGQQHETKKQKGKGQNKKRYREKTVPSEERPCLDFLRGAGCRFGDKCKFSHDIQKLMAGKAPDINPRCINFDKFGSCPYGMLCRFGGAHIDDNLKNIVDEEKVKETGGKCVVRNLLSKDLQIQLRKRNVHFKKSDQYMRTLDTRKKESNSKRPEGPGCKDHNESPTVVMPTSGDAHNHAGTVTDADVIKLRPEEKKKLDVKDKLLLAPLTTVGNLPFRAVCKKLGADITCGEMAMCTNLLQGQSSEWALLRRHPSEDVFGVQLCGGFPDTMTRCAELLNDRLDIDFIDINVGCPIDLVYHKGAGSGLMNRMGKFQEIVRGMSSVLDIPLTVKMRTGVHNDNPVAHKIVRRIYDWGASVVTVHGRTREQRYSKLADWDYLKDCVQAADPHPFIGNGDILSFEDSNFFREQSGATGQMIARGALIKPWIFTEIKEQRHWDISSSERFDILQDYINLGLLHWGSDSEGVRKTRRFLLEWLSFLHRYIPVGLLETLPQKINERPPYYVGRDDLETLMASANCADWVKISEMFLGPVPDDFQFLAKHKASSYK